jgi:hypothetical protein
VKHALDAKGELTEVDQETQVLVTLLEVEEALLQVLGKDLTPCLGF